MVVFVKGEDLITTTSICPMIPINFDRNLLSIPIFKFDSEYLLEIAQWLENKLLNREFHKYPSTIVKIRQQIKQFMELYERAKDEEREAEGKTFIKAKEAFYRPRLSNRNGQRAFEELDNRRKTSKYDRKNIKVSKVRNVK